MLQVKDDLVASGPVHIGSIELLRDVLKLLVRDGEPAVSPWKEARGLGQDCGQQGQTLPCCPPSSHG